MSEQVPRRLNFGCGYDKRDGYLNVDSDPACDPDVLLLDNDLTVLRGEPFSEILALDVLEHIPRVKTLTVLLEWADLLEDGGRLILKTSSIPGVAKQLAADDSFREQYGWTLCLFGSQAHPGDFHLTGFTDITLRVHLLAAGFDVERIWLADKWLLHAEAKKASSWSAAATELDELDNDAFVTRIYPLALGREADAGGREFLCDQLASGAWDRRDALSHLMCSAERLFYVAEGHGHGQRPTTSVLAAVLERTPDFLRPALRRAGHTGRSLASSARRTLGRRQGACVS